MNSPRNRSASLTCRSAKPKRATEIAPSRIGGCGGKKNVNYTDETFDYIPGVVWLLFPLFGILIAVLFKSMIKRAVVSIPRCGECSVGARRAQEATGPIGIGGVLVLLATATAAGNDAPVLAVVIFLLGALAFLVAMRRW